MIKGVNKQIIEIKCTNSEYFERALLFVNSNCELFSETEPKVVAGEYLQKLTDEMESRSKNPICYLFKLQKILGNYWLLRIFVL